MTKIPDAVRCEVEARTGQLCHLCLHRLGYQIPVTPAAAGYAVRRIRLNRGAKRIAHMHHVFVTRRWPELAVEPWNLIGLCIDHHFAHHHAPGQRIPLAVLPPQTVALAAGDGPRTNYLERTYPLTDAGRLSAAPGDTT